MSAIVRDDVNIMFRNKFDLFLNRIDKFQNKFNRYVVDQSYQGKFLKPASQLIENRLQYLKWLISSICLLEIEFEINNKIMEKYSELDEVCEDSHYLVKRLFDSKCLHEESFNSLKEAKFEFEKKYNQILENRRKSDHYFLEALPSTKDELSALVPFDLNKTYDADQFKDLIIVFLSKVPVYRDKVNLEVFLDDFLQKTKMLNEVLNDEFEPNFEFMKSYLDLSKKIIAEY